MLWHDGMCYNGMVCTAKGWHVFQWDGLEFGAALSFDWRFMGSAILKDFASHKTIKRYLKLGLLQTYMCNLFNTMVNRTIFQCRLNVSEKRIRSENVPKGSCRDGDD